MQHRRSISLITIVSVLLFSLSFCGCIESDTDGDKLTDSIEIEGMEIMIYHINGTIQELTVTSDPNKVDTDGDGLSDYEEAIASTNPSVKDTDGDGLDDNEEVGTQSSPFHFDTWLITVKGVEQRVYAQYPDFASLPTEYDSDKDGLMDSEEYQKKTNPNNADTDGDGSDDLLDPEPNWNLQMNLSLDTFTLKKNKDPGGGADLYFAIQIGDVTTTTDVFDVPFNQQTSLDLTLTIDFSDNSAYETNAVQIQIIAIDEDPTSFLGDELLAINQGTEEYNMQFDISELDATTFSTSGDDGDLDFTVDLFKS